MPTRRQLLLSTLLMPGLLEPSTAAPDTLPDGVIAPHVWNDTEIPVSGTAPKVIEDAVKKAMRQYGIVGCGICVVQNDRILYTQGFGYAELNKTPFQPTTATRCGSLAKPVTSVCALLLMDQGKLDLDAEILPLLKAGGILPTPLDGLQVDERIARIRVRHLMDHTSGFSRGATYTAWRADRNVAALHKLDHVATGADVVSDALGNKRLDSEPGTAYQYANINFVLLARLIEIQSEMHFNDFLTKVAMPKFGVAQDGIYVSRNQVAPHSSLKGKNEADYYQTADERYVSFVPSEQSRGRVYGEAYRGYATESSDGAGGIACTAPGLGQILANLHSATPTLSPKAMHEILTPPVHYTSQPGFDPASSGYYSKGFDVRYSGGRPWLAHGGMTIHCGGAIGHNAGFQFVAVSNWNNAQGPFVDSILDRALAESVAKQG